MDGRSLTLLVVATSLLLGACDKTVGLDPTRPTFTDLLVPGACKAQDDLRYADVSVMMLLDGDEAILPTTRLRRQPAPVGELLDVNDFRFTLPATTPIEVEQAGFAEPQGGGTQEGVGLQPDALEFQWSGGEDRARDEKLVVFLLDSSGSLIGEDPRTMGIDVDKASDLNDERITFFRELLGVLDADDFVSLVWFKESFPVFDDLYSRPTKNRDVIKSGLNDLGFQESGTTPLADALDQTLVSLIDFNKDLNPVVVLFTDGIEDGDVSSKTLAEVTQKYAQHVPPVPVIVLELKPDEATTYHKTRSRALVDLACATGGEHLYLERAAESSERSNLRPIVRNRITGAWRLKVQTTLDNAQLFPAGEYFLSSELSLTLDEKSRSAPLVRARDNEGEFGDSRLWFYK